MNAWDKTLDIADFVGYVAVGILRAVGEIIGEREEALQGNRVSPKTGAKLDLMENSTTEFKTSIIFSPDDNQPSPNQPLKIAQEMAGFMNAEGAICIWALMTQGMLSGFRMTLIICGKQRFAVKTKRATDPLLTGQLVTPILKSCGTSLASALERRRQHFWMIQCLYMTI